MTEPEIIVERKKYGSSAMDYTMRVYQKLDEETIMIDGVKYQKVEEPKPQTLYGIIRRWWGDNETGQELVSRFEKWLPDELSCDNGVHNGVYELGWNDAITTIKDKLK